MQFIYGLLTAVVFFILFMLFFYAGIRFEKQKKPPDTEVEKKEQEKRQVEQFNKHFKELFAYDVDKALQRKKVQ